MPNIIITEDESNVIATATGFTPDENLFVQMTSRPVPPNESTEGIGALVYTETDDNGACRFHAPKDFLLPELPRDVTAVAAVGEFATSARSFT